MLSFLRAVRLIHPFPTVLNALAAAGLAIVAERGLPDAGALVRIVWTMLAVQAAIGTVNDLADRHLDAKAKPSKPIPAGIVSPAAAWLVAAAAMIAALALGFTLGPAAWLLSTAGLCIGLAYDLRLKRTSLSWLTYAVALPLVPLWVWTALGRFAPSLLWVLPIGLVLGGALHLANALPDLESDAAGDVRGAAQVLGQRRALVAAWVGYAIAAVGALVLGLILGADRPVLVVGCGAALLLLAAAVAVYARRPGRAALQIGWTLLAPGAGLLAVAWLAALPPV